MLNNLNFSKRERIRIFIISVLLLFTHQVFSQATLVSGSTTISKSGYTVGNGSDRLIIVTLAAECNNNACATATSVTWGGESLILASTASTTRLKQHLWYLKESSISSLSSNTNDFIVTWSNPSSVKSESFHAVTLANVDQSGTMVSGTGSSPNNTNSVTSSSISVVGNGIVYYGASTRRSNSAHSPPTGSIETSDQSPNLFSTGSAYKSIITAGFEAPTATFVGTHNMAITALFVPGLSSVLPIELLSFEAKAVENRHIQLVWATASEVNNDYFTVERSQNGIDWEVIGTVKGAGNSSSTVQYDFIDDIPYIFGTSYYRLKQTDFDGTYKRFNVKPVSFEKIVTEVNTVFKLYPNPTNDIVSIENSHALQEQDVIFFNIMGQNVTHFTHLVLKSDEKIVLNITNLVSGTYYVKIKDSLHTLLKQ